MTKFLTSVLLCSLVSVSALADTEKASYGGDPSSQETTGFFTGVALGALAGGPPGAIVGGALGAVFGDGWHARQEVGLLQQLIKLDVEKVQVRNYFVVFLSILMTILMTVDL